MTPRLIDTFGRVHNNLRISVTGTLLDASTRVGGSISGAALWFYLPERAGS